MTEKGIVYITTGEDFVEEAKISARSVKDQMPETPITIITDQNPSDEVFDQVIDIQNPRNDFGDKVVNLDRIPYEKAIFLDTDIYVEQDISEIFDLLDEFDLAAAMAPVGYDSNLDVPESFPEYNTGVIGLKKSDKLTDFIEQFQSMFHKENLDEDQPMFRKALYESSLRIATLPTEYNCRFSFPGYVEGDVKIFHGRLKDIETLGLEKKVDVREAIEKINSVEYPRVHFLKGGELKLKYNQSGLGGKLKQSISERGVEGSFRRFLEKLGV